MLKNCKRVGAVVLALAMAFSVMCVSAFAADGVGTDSIEITKEVTTDGNTMAPNTSFTFTIAPAGAGTYDGNTVYAGVAGGASFDGNTTKDITFTPGGKGSAAATYTGKATITTSVNAFDGKPGIYHYTVTETEGNYEGITYDTTTRDLYVYVTNSGSGVAVSNVVLTKGSTKTDKWTNDYGDTHDTTHDVTISKTVTGNMADTNKEFTFTVKVDGASGEKYKFVVNDTEENPLVSGTATTITLKGGQKAQIYGLTENDKVTATEEDYSSDGYTTTVTASNVTGKSDRGVTEGKVSKDGATVEVTNTKDATPPTGVVMSVAPYVLMVAVAAGIAVFFLRRRNAE